MKYAEQEVIGEKAAGDTAADKERNIPRPDITVAQIILLMLAERGRLTFQEIIKHPAVRLLGQERTENSFYVALARLKRRRQVHRAEGGQYELTPSGERAALKAYIRKELVQSEKKLQAVSYKLLPTASWDGKWRVVLFDFPESKRPLRDYVRSLLRRIGFYEFQRSTWILPYRPPTFLLRAFADPIFRSHVRMCTTSDIDYDDDLRRRFRLS